MKKYLKSKPCLVALSLAAGLIIGHSTSDSFQKNESIDSPEVNYAALPSIRPMSYRLKQKFCLGLEPVTRHFSDVAIKGTRSSFRHESVEAYSLGDRGLLCEVHGAVVTESTHLGIHQTPKSFFILSDPVSLIHDEIDEQFARKLLSLNALKAIASNHPDGRLMIAKVDIGPIVID